MQTESPLALIIRAAFSLLSVHFYMDFQFVFSSFDGKIDVVLFFIIITMASVARITLSFQICFYFSSSSLASCFDLA